MLSVSRNVKQRVCESLYLRRAPRWGGVHRKRSNTWAATSHGHPTSQSALSWPVSLLSSLPHSIVRCKPTVSDLIVLTIRVKTYDPTPRDGTVPCMEQDSGGNPPNLRERINATNYIKSRPKIILISQNILMNNQGKHTKKWITPEEIKISGTPVRSSGHCPTWGDVGEEQK